MAAKNQTGSSKASSAKDLLASLGGKKVKTAAKTAERAEIELTAEEKVVLDRLAGADGVEELAAKRKKAESNTLKPSIFQRWVARLWKNKSKPANPLLVGNESSCILQIKESLKVQCPEPKEGETREEVLIEKLKEQFVEVGVPVDDAESDAQRLVNNEVDFSEKKSIDLNKLVFGHWEGSGDNRTFIEATEEQQALAVKVVTILSENLSEEEMEQVVDIKDAVSVKRGFIQRSFTYARSLDQLDVIFSMIKPELAISSVKFADGVSPEEKKDKLLQVSGDLIGVKVKEVTK